MAVASSANRQAALRERRRWPADFSIAETQLVRLIADKQQDPLDALSRIAEAWPRSHRDYAYAAEVAA